MRLMLRVMIILKSILKILSIFIVYKWASELIHEIGHFLTSKLYGHKCHIEIKYSKYLMPIMCVHIESDHQLHFIENIMITISGVVFQILLSLICIYQNIFQTINYISVFYLSAIFLNVIPKYNADGHYINEVIKSSLKFRKKTINIITVLQWGVPISVIIFVFIYAVKSTYMAIYILDYDLLMACILGYVLVITSIIFLCKNYVKSR